MNIKIAKLLGCFVVLMLGLCPKSLVAETYLIELAKSPIPASVHFSQAEFVIEQEAIDMTGRAFFDEVLRPSFNRHLANLPLSERTGQVVWKHPRVVGSQLVIEDSPVWLAAEFKNGYPYTLDLMLEKFGFGLVKWYLVEPSGTVTYHKDDLTAQRAGRPVFDVTSVIPFQLGPGESVQIFVELTIFSEANWTINLWQADEFRAQRLKAMMLDGLYFGLLLTLVLFCIVVYLNIREPVYLLFGLYLLSCGATVYFGGNLHQQFLLEDYFSEGIAFLYLSTGMVDFLAAIFSIMLLRIYQTKPVLFRVWLIMISANLLTVAFGVYAVSDTETSSSEITALIIASLMCGVLEQVVYIWTLISCWHSSRLTRYWFLVIFIHSMLFLLWSAVAADPSLTNVDPKRVVQLVTVFDAVMICIVLAYVYRFERSERLTAQDLSVENLRLARDIDQARSNFISTVSHDLHGPVRAISFFAESLRSETTDRGRLGIQRIEENVQTVTSMLDSLVRFSEADSHTQLFIEEVDLSHILYTLKNEFDPIARLKTVTLVIPDSQLKVETDPVGLSQVLRNLLDNALKYTSFGEVRVAIQEESKSVCIAISDTGRGIADTELENVFDEFYQVSKNDSQGVGLGLSIVARLTRQLGIELRVSSVLGQGSEFHIVIPKKFPEALLAQTVKSVVGDTLDLAVGIINIESPDLDHVVSQLRGWQVTLTSEPTDFGEVDLLVAALSESSSEILRRHPSKPVFLFGEEQGFVPPSDRYLILPGNVEPMKLRASLQKILRSRVA